MKKEEIKFSENNKDKRTNTIIEIRKEILTILRDIGDDLNRELSNFEEQKKISKEVKQIAKLIRDKDMYMKKASDLEKLSKKEMYVKDDLIRETRNRAKILFELNFYNLNVEKYDSEELEIIFNEIEEAKYLLYEKDRLIEPENKEIEKEIRVPTNPHLKKFFNMDAKPER